MKSSVLLCFTGMDGTGKTTYALATKNYLEEKGVKCNYLWFRYDMSILFSFMTKALAWLLLGRKRPIDEHIPKNKALAYTWLLSSIIDYILYILCNIIPRLSKTALICDRYVYDIFVRLEFLGMSTESYRRFLLTFTPRPDLIFLLDVSPRIAFARRKEFSLDYYARQRKLYRKILDCITLNYVVLCTDKSNGDIRDKIFRYLDLYLHMRKRKSIYA